MYMTRLSRSLIIVGVVLVICTGLSFGLLAVHTHRIGEPTIEYAEYAISDFFTYVKSSLMRPSTEFRFETYDPDELVTVDAMTEAAEADLYKLFPRGTEVQPFVELMNQIGARCYNLEQPERPLSCGYVYTTWTKFIRVGIYWNVDVYRDESGEKVERFWIKVRGRR